MPAGTEGPRRHYFMRDYLSGKVIVNNKIINFCAFLIRSFDSLLKTRPDSSVKTHSDSQLKISFYTKKNWKHVSSWSAFFHIFRGKIFVKCNNL